MRCEMVMMIFMMFMNGLQVYRTASVPSLPEIYIASAIWGCL